MIIPTHDRPRIGENPKRFAVRQSLVKGAARPGQPARGSSLCLMMLYEAVAQMTCTVSVPLLRGCPHGSLAPEGSQA